jgi:N-acetylglucosamine-6-phosphate deacetylase
MPGANQNKTLILRAGRVVLPDAVRQNAVITIADGLIQKISSDSSIRVYDHELNFAGATVFPGFIDLHIHGSVGVDLMTADADDLQFVSGHLAGKGVTGWLPTLVPSELEQYQSAVSAIDNVLREQAGGQDSETGARVLGVHYEGPFVNSAKCGALHREYFRKFSSAAELETLPVPQAGAKLMTLAPEVEGGIDLIRELSKRNWIASIGHTCATVEVLDQAHVAGARHMTHFMNAMAPFDHRSPGPVTWGLMRDDVTCDFIADGIHLDRFVLGLLAKLKTPERLVLISDAIAAAGKGDGEYDIWGETITVKNGRTSNANGSIAGSVISMLEAVRMMFAIGASEVDVARMAATNPARLLDIADEGGSIEEGKRADLVALDQDGDVLMTMVGGRIVFQS